MTTTAGERRFVIWSSLAAAVLSLLSSILGDAARYDDGTFLADASDLHLIDAGKAAVYRAAAVTDMLGSYLLLIPAALWLWRRLRDEHGLLADLTLATGILYAALGATGAAILASARTPFIEAYATATEIDQAAMSSSYVLLTDSVSGIWQIGVGTIGGVWWLTVGILGRRRWRAFAIASMIFGVLAVLGSASRWLGADYESSGPATPFFLPIVVFAAWVAFTAWREPAVA